MLSKFLLLNRHFDIQGFFRRRQLYLMFNVIWCAAWVQAQPAADVGDCLGIGFAFFGFISSKSFFNIKFSITIKTIRLRSSKNLSAGGYIYCFMYVRVRLESGRVRRRRL